VEELHGMEVETTFQSDMMTLGSEIWCEGKQDYVLAGIMMQSMQKIQAIEDFCEACFGIH